LRGNDIMEMKPIHYKKKIICNDTETSLLPCGVCLQPTRHRHKIVNIDWNWGGSSIPICEDCCKNPEIKPVPPSVKDQYMLKRMLCLICNHLGREIDFKRFRSSHWLICPNCKTRKNKDAKDRSKAFRKVFLIPREFQKDKYYLDALKGL